MGGRCNTKERGRNNVSEINARDAVAEYREQRRQANRRAHRERERYCRDSNRGRRRTVKDCHRREQKKKTEDR